MGLGRAKLKGVASARLPAQRPHQFYLTINLVTEALRRWGPLSRASEATNAKCSDPESKQLSQACFKIVKRLSQQMLKFRGGSSLM